MIPNHLNVYLPEEPQQYLYRDLRATAGTWTVGYALLREILPHLAAHVRERGYPLTINSRWLGLDYMQQMQGDPRFGRLRSQDFILVTRVGCRMLGYTHAWGSRNHYVVAREACPCPPSPALRSIKLEE